MRPTHPTDKRTIVTAVWVLGSHLREHTHTEICLCAGHTLVVPLCMQASVLHRYMYITHYTAVHLTLSTCDSGCSAVTIHAHEHRARGCHACCNITNQNVNHTLGPEMGPKNTDLA